MANSKLCAKYQFEKPNDKRALDLMNAAARVVVTELPDITIAYGHINNLYNTTFWSLIQLGGYDNKTAEQMLAGTVSGDKNEILFSKFNINYNNEPEMYKKGSVIFRDYELVEPGTHNASEAADALAEPTQQSKSQAEKEKKKRNKARVVIEHLDIIKDDFWDRRPWLLSNKPGKTPKEP
ncbi:hypothetical protein COL940_002440 [Colletotrichum noveboracense]|nr:hypothetical protein COL940_002440 [Colletotrichum noveboracense]